MQLEVKVPGELSAKYDVIFYFGKGNENYIKEVISNFIKVSGTPNFVGDKYGIVEEILQQYGKRLKRKFDGSLVGKWVVDT